jgi:hypothetical protein
MQEEVKMWETLPEEDLRRVDRVGLNLEDRIEKWLEKDGNLRFIDCMDHA